jgi:uncharacterized membrane protein YdbT with pleckstrin-like domain
MRAMPTIDRYLAEDEELIHVTRQHWTQLVGEFAVLCLIWAIVGAAVWALPDGQDWARTGAYVVLGAGLLVSVWFWLVPLLKWRSTIYILTTRRIHMRAGFLAKTGRSIPLERVNDISFESSLWERIIRCGTLKIESGSEQGLMTLKHVPDPEGLKTMVYEAMDDEPVREHQASG